MHPHTDQERLRAQCAQAGDFKQVGRIMVAEALKFEGPIEIVCGPITTGGFNDINKNIAAFNGAIRDLAAQGLPIYNQIPYEESILRLKTQWKAGKALTPGQYCWPVLWDLYFPLFATRRITVAHFLPGSEESVGSRWERRWLEYFGAKIRDLDQSYANKLTQ